MSETLWTFDDLAASEPDRAAALCTAPSDVEIALEVTHALEAALARGDVRLGMDDSNGSDRAVIQFHVGQALFDQFFNGLTGYRAQFRKAAAMGHAFNRKLVIALRGVLASGLHAEVEVRRLNALFEDVGGERVIREKIIASLDPELSKVWFCRKLIRRQGGVDHLLVDLSGPRLRFDEYESWAAPYADEEAAWLDLKGAFLGADGPFQIKNPAVRADELHRLGSA